MNTPRENDLLLVLARLVNAHIGTDGWVDNECMSAGESACEVLEEHGLYERHNGRYGKLTSEGMAIVAPYSADRNSGKISVLDFARSAPKITPLSISVRRILNAIEGMVLQYSDYNMGMFEANQLHVNAAALHIMIEYDLVEVDGEYMTWISQGKAILGEF